MKKLIKNFACGILYSLGVPKAMNFNTRIIAFHTVNPDYFESQMEYLKKNYNVVTLQEAIKDMSKKQVAITFDDGYKNNYLYAYPVLKKLKLKATVFVTYDFISKDTFTWWDRLECSNKKYNLKYLKKKNPEAIEREVYSITNLKCTDKKPLEYKFMVWEDLKKIKDVFEVGSHTLSHPILTNVSLKEAEKEIRLSKKMIGEKIRANVVSFAYPNGDCDPSIIQLVKTAGYKCAAVYRDSKNDDSNTFSLFRRGINKEDNLVVFACKVGGIF